MNHIFLFLLKEKNVVQLSVVPPYLDMVYFYISDVGLIGSRYFQTEV